MPRPALRAAQKPQAGFSEDPPRPRMSRSTPSLFLRARSATTRSVIWRMQRSPHSRMLSGALSCVDLSLLLDSLDKVRVGLWLGFVYLAKNMWGIDPKLLHQQSGRAD